MSKHIKGQQDKAALAISGKAQWNDEMDQAAKNHWHLNQPRPHHP